MGRKLCLITGASSGIGGAFAELYAKQGWDLVLVARREDRLLALKADIEATHGISARVLVGDLSDPRTPRRLMRDIDAPIDGLVNNAGFAPGPDMLRTPWIDHLAFLQTVLAGPTELAHLCTPGMRERGYGRVINVCSMLAVMPAAGEGSLYGPAKAFMMKFSEALHASLRGTGVHVTGLLPGFTDTEIFQGNGSDELVRETIPSVFWQTPAQVALRGYEASERNKPVAISGAANKAQAVLMKLLPDDAARALVRQMGKRSVPPLDDSGEGADANG